MKISHLWPMRLQSDEVAMNTKSRIRHGTYASFAMVLCLLHLDNKNKKFQHVLDPDVFCFYLDESPPPLLPFAVTTIRMRWPNQDSKEIRINSAFL